MRTLNYGPKFNELCNKLLHDMQENNRARALFDVDDFLTDLLTYVGTECEDWSPLSRVTAKREVRAMKAKLRANATGYSVITADLLHMVEDGLQVIQDRLMSDHKIIFKF